MRRMAVFILAITTLALAVASITQAGASSKAKTHSAEAKADSQVARIEASAEPLISCFGAGLDKGYVAEFDQLEGQGGTNGLVDLPYPAWFLMNQSWGTHPGDTPGNHSEHFHVDMCFPNGETITTGSFPIYIKFTAHNVTDYKLLGFSMSAVTGPDFSGDNQGSRGSKRLFEVGPDILARMQEAMDASGNGSVQVVYFKVMTEPPTRNGWRELRGGFKTEENGPDAIFHTWHFDMRAYWTYNVAGLPAGSPPPLNQRAVRNRSQLTSRRADGTITNEDYHHAGYCDMNGQIKHPVGSVDPTTGASIDTDCQSQDWTREFMARQWSRSVDKLIGLYVTDGGGHALLMIDPDFHKHYDKNNPADQAACPNIDSAGNCLGVWYWEPDNSRHELFNKALPQVHIPQSVMASLSPGLHRLVFKSDDAPECERTGKVCPPGTRGEWSNVVALPFEVAPN